MKSILGKKIGMTQLFHEDGRAIPITLVETEIDSDISIFSEGDKIKISGISKGKGFQGVVKRHGFSGMPSSHGHKHVKRHPGSIGQRFPQHTLKGMKMAGRMGGKRVTIRKLEIVKIDKDNNILAVKGAVPGRKGTVLKITNL